MEEARESPSVTLSEGGSRRISEFKAKRGRINLPRLIAQLKRNLGQLLLNEADDLGELLLQRCHFAL